jgi:hypothetical protein
MRHASVEQRRRALQPMRCKAPIAAQNRTVAEQLVWMPGSQVAALGLCVVGGVLAIGVLGLALGACLAYQATNG